jgi:A/G-specific adenine glycosylase
MTVSDTLQHWYAEHKRDLPWRKTVSPYHIWLSEIILQQTRVAQGLDFYMKFLERYPRIEDLANASLDDVLKLWQGLGYYTRARNLHQTAKLIASEMKGVFPRNFHDLLQLKGIGQYTAAAIASIAYREPVAVVDGNAFRVLSRFFGIELPFGTLRGKQAIDLLATEILDKANPDVHNQAIMELGALVCLPRNPLCGVCPLAADCMALKSGKTDLLPVKDGKKPPRDRYFNYLFLVNKGTTWLKKRSSHDIWHSLYEFPLIESSGRVIPEELFRTKEWHDMMGMTTAELIGPVMYYKHQLTHQTLHCSFYHMTISEFPANDERALLKIGISDLDSFAVPRLIEKYLHDLKHNEGV